MNIRLAVSITGTTIEEAIAQIDIALAKQSTLPELVTDYILELRIDAITDLSEKGLDRLIQYCNLPLIVTNRHAKEADDNPKFGFKGIIATNSEDIEKERIHYLMQAINAGVAYVDIENAHYYPLDRKDTKLIISAHDFKKSFDQKELHEMYDSMQKKHADIAKFATMPHSDIDSALMLNCIYDITVERTNYHAEYPEIIGLSMGNEGRITRILGPLIGGYLSFAALTEEQASAPGQIIVEDWCKKVIKAYEITDKVKTTAGYITLPELREFKKRLAA